MNSSGAVVIAFLISLAILPFVLGEYDTESVIDKKSNSYKAHNLILGQRKSGDRILFHNELNLQRKLLRSTQYDVKYPQTSSIQFKNSVITYIEVLDLKHDGTGGYPTLYRGGINYNYATIRLKSQWNHGLHFNVSLYGIY